MNRPAFLFLMVTFGILAGLGCGKDRPAVSSAGLEEGEIAFEITYAPWKPILAKPAAISAIDKATVYVYDMKNSQLLEKDLTIADGRASGTVAIKGQDNLRVVLALFAGDMVNYIGEDPDVDVPTRGAATAHIVVHYMGTTIVAPDSALVGEKYRLTWSKLPFLRWYEVQESLTPDFSKQVDYLYNGPDTTFVVEGKSYVNAAKTFYYRIRAVTLYGNGPWYGQGSTGIAGIDGTIIIDLSVPQSPPGKSVTLTAPNGGSIRGGSTVAITWTSALVENVGIEYSIDGGASWLRIEESVPAWRKRCEWTAPVSAVANCLVRVFDAENTTVSDTSRSSFAITSNTGITMVSIPGGRFQMGSFDKDYEDLPTTVTISAFKMGATEITQDQYFSVTGADPSTYHGSGSLPVDGVSWYDAVQFCNKLSIAEGLQPCYIDSAECDFTKNGYRLPTDAEWEYACRAGTITRYYGGDTIEDLDRGAWFLLNSNNTPHDVGLRSPNSWSLYDMHGNVWEWTNDWKPVTPTNIHETRYIYTGADPTGPVTGTLKKCRGGAFNMDALPCRAAHTEAFGPTYKSKPNLKYKVGFRVVRRPGSSGGHAAKKP